MTSSAKTKQPMQELRQWGRDHYLNVEAARANYDLTYRKNHRIR